MRKPLAAVLLAFTAEVIDTITVKFRGSTIERQGHVIAEPVSRFRDRFSDYLQGRLI